MRLRSAVDGTVRSSSIMGSAHMVTVGQDMLRTVLEADELELEVRVLNKDVDLYESNGRRL